MSGKIKNYFPGGNTSKGFYSFYNYILPQDKAEKIICLKGGPGTGKSSLIKKVGDYFNKKNFDIEFHHCSSDNNSLDGVVINKIGVAMMDGTAPHVVDPKTPGAVDEILNLGDCWNEANLKKYKLEILQHNFEIGELFKRAYRFLKASSEIYEDWEVTNKTHLNREGIELLKEDLKEKTFTKRITTPGRERHLFATAFTPLGTVTYIDNLIEDYENVYVLEGEPGTGKNEVLTFIYKESIKRGYNCEIFHCPLVPEKLEHVLIPELKTAFITSNEINSKLYYGKQIDMRRYLDKLSIINKDRTLEDKKLFFELLNKAIDNLNAAKILHDKTEKYYIASMDFDKINAITENIITRLSDYAKE